MIRPYPTRAMSDRPGDLPRRTVLGLAAAAAVLAVRTAEAGPRRPKRGGTLKHIGLDPWSFDVQGSGGDPAQLISSFVRRTLFKLTASAAQPKLVPDLALKAEATPDGQTYTIALRPGVMWERRAPVNGRALTSADVKYTLERAARKSPYASFLGPVQGVEAPDQHTVRVHLASPFAPFLHNLAEPWLAILPSEVEEKLGDFRSADALVGCGPFVLERYEPGVKAVFARNPTYYQKGLPYLDKLEWLFIRERSTQISLFRAGQVDIPTPDGQVPRAQVGACRRANPTYPIAWWDGLSVRSLALRSDKPPFDNVKVRRALSLAVDRKKWLTQYLEGQGVEEPGPVPAALREWKLTARDLGEGARYLEHDPALARKLLVEAGYVNGVKVHCTRAPGAAPEDLEALELLAHDLRQIGVELLAGSDGRLDEAAWGPPAFFTEVDGHLYGSFKSGQPGNRGHVADAELDAMLDAQRRSTSRVSRRKLIHDIQRHVADRVYYLYPPGPRLVSSWSARVKNYAPTSSLDRGSQLEGVWVDG
jgi:ABC-type transport system substrate-binding protein